MTLRFPNASLEPIDSVADSKWAAFTIRLLVFFYILPESFDGLSVPLSRSGLVEKKRRTTDLRRIVERWGIVEGSAL